MKKIIKLIFASIIPLLFFSCSLEKDDFTENSNKINLRFTINDYEIPDSRLSSPSALDYNLNDITSILLTYSQSSSPLNTKLVSYTKSADGLKSAYQVFKESTLSLEKGTWTFSLNVKAEIDGVITETGSSSLQNVEISNSSNSLEFTLLPVGTTGKVKLNVYTPISKTNYCVLKLYDSSNSLIETKTITKQISESHNLYVYENQLPAELAGKYYRACFYFYSDAEGTKFTGIKNVLFLLVSRYLTEDSYDFDNFNSKYSVIYDNNDHKYIKPTTVLVSEYSPGVRFFLPTSDDMFRQGAEFLGWKISGTDDTDIIDSYTSTASMTDDISFESVWDVKNTLYITNSGNDTNNAGISSTNSFKTIQKAVDVAILNRTDTLKNFTIKIDDGTILDILDDYSENNNSFINISPTDDMEFSIESVNSASLLNLYCNNKCRALYVGNKANVTLSNFKISACETTESGGAIYNSGTLTLNKVTIYGSTSGQYGGAIYSGPDSFISIDECEINGNTSINSGGGIYLDERSYINIYSSKVSANTSSNGSGGAIYVKNGAYITMDGGEIMQNSAKNGGAITSDTVKNSCVFKYVQIGQNKASGNGGAIQVNQGRYADFNNCEFTENYTTSETSLGTTIYSVGTTYLINASILPGSASGTDKNPLNSGVIHCTNNNAAANLNITEGIQIQEKDGMYGIYLDNSKKTISLSGKILCTAPIYLAQEKQIGFNGVIASDSIINIALENTERTSAITSNYNTHMAGVSPESIFKISGGIFTLNASGEVVYSDAPVESWSTLSTLISAQPQNTSKTYKLKGSLQATNQIMIEDKTVKLVPYDDNYVTISCNASGVDSILNTLTNLTIEGTETAKIIFEGVSGVKPKTLITARNIINCKYVNFKNCSTEAANIHLSEFGSEATFEKCTFTGCHGDQYGQLNNHKSSNTTLIDTIFEEDATQPSNIFLMNNTSNLTIKGKCVVPVILTHSNTPAPVILSDITSGSSIGYKLENPASFTSGTEIFTCSSNDNANSYITSYLTCLSSDFNFDVSGKNITLERPDNTTVAYFIANGGVPDDTTITYSVSTEDDLHKISEWVKNGSELDGISFLQTGPITITHTFTPIGNSKDFKGNYDGGNNTITILDMDTSYTYTALFGSIYNSKISNIILNGNDIESTKSYISGIACYVYGKSFIYNCTNNINLKSTYIAGGIVGEWVADPQGAIINCVNHGNIEGEEKAGGMIGWTTNSNTYVINNLNTGTISTTRSSSYTGGMVGYDQTKALRLYYNINTGAISSPNSQHFGAMYGGSAEIKAAQYNFIYIDNCDAFANNSTSIPADNTGFSSQDPLPDGVASISTIATEINAKHSSLPTTLSALTILSEIPLKEWDYNTENGFLLKD